MARVRSDPDGAANEPVPSQPSPRRIDEGRTRRSSPTFPRGFRRSMASLAVIEALVDAGARTRSNWACLFPIPVADGPVIREALHVALGQRRHADLDHRADPRGPGARHRCADRAHGLLQPLPSLWAGTADAGWFRADRRADRPRPLAGRGGTLAVGAGDGRYRSGGVRGADHDGEPAARDPRQQAAAFSTQSRCAVSPAAT